MIDTPFPPFPSVETSVTVVPIKLPVSELYSVPDPEMETPCWPLFEMTEVDIVLCVAPPEIAIPLPVLRRELSLKSSPVSPVGSVPMKSPVNVLPLVPEPLTVTPLPRVDATVLPLTRSSLAPLNNSTPKPPLPLLT